MCKFFREPAVFHRMRLGSARYALERTAIAQPVDVEVRVEREDDGRVQFVCEHDESCIGVVHRQIGVALDQRRAAPQRDSGSGTREPSRKPSS